MAGQREIDSMQRVHFFALEVASPLPNTSLRETDPISRDRKSATASWVLGGILEQRGSQERLI